MLAREEYVEQAYLFRILAERLKADMPLQELLEHVREEVLATAKLPLAIDFMLAELRHQGVFGPAMRKLAHYFAPFQAYLVDEAENERGRFDMLIAVQVLRHEAEYRADDPTPQGLFFFQFETLCRNRLRYDQGLTAISEDPLYDAAWREWALMIRKQVGLVDLADLIFIRSEHFAQKVRLQPGETLPPILFGEKEGRIAYANRRKDPLLLFAALQRHLGYPPVPRPTPRDPTPELIPQLLRRLERIEVRLKLMEEEQREGSIDLSRFYGKPGAE